MAIEFNGIKTTILDLSHAYGLHYTTLLQRYREGKRGDELVAGGRYKNQVIIEGRIYSLFHLAKSHNYNYQLLLNRYRQGLRGSDLIAGLDKCVVVDVKVERSSTSAETIRGIYQDAWSRDYSNAEVAAKYGVSESTVSRIKNRHRWPNLTEDLENRRLKYLKGERI